MSSSLSLSSRGRIVWIALAVVGVAIVAIRCSTEPQATPGPRKATVRSSPRGPRSATEVESVNLFLRQLPSEGPTRVVVRLAGVKMSDGRDVMVPWTDGAMRKAAQDRIGHAQAQFLSHLPTGSNRRVQRFRSIPYLALDLTHAEAVAVRDWLSTQDANRTFEVFLSPVRELMPTCTTTVTDPPLTFLPPLDRLEWIVEAPASTPVVAVVDSRVDPAVEFLKDRLAGRDAISPGYEPGDADEDGPPFVAPSGYGHGTEVACVAAAADPWCEILSLRVDDANGKIHATDAALALDAIYDLWNDKLNQRIKAVVVSLGDHVGYTPTAYCGSDEEDTRTFLDALTRMNELGIPVVVAAGNISTDVPAVEFPACFENVVTVTGTLFSPVEPSPDWCWSTVADLCAPGAGVKVALPGRTYGSSMGSGTSIAAPIVAGALSRLLSLETKARADQALGALKSTGFGMTSRSIEVREVRLAPALQQLRGVVSAQ